MQSIFEQHNMIPHFAAARFLNDRLGDGRCWFTFLNEDRRSRRIGHLISWWRDPSSGRVFYRVPDLQAFVEAVKANGGYLPARPVVRERAA